MPVRLFRHCDRPIVTVPAVAIQIGMCNLFGTQRKPVPSLNLGHVEVFNILIAEHRIGVRRVGGELENLVLGVVHHVAKCVVHVFCSL